MASRCPSGAHAAIPFENPLPPGGRGAAAIGWPDGSTNARLVTAGPSRTIDTYAMTSAVGDHTGSDANVAVGIRSAVPPAAGTDQRPGPAPAPAPYTMR